MRPAAIAAILGRSLHSGAFLFESAAKLLSLVPGKFGQRLRAAYYRQTLVRCAEDLDMGFLSVFTDPLAAVGTGVRIGNICSLGAVVIDNGVTTGNRVSIHAAGPHSRSVQTGPIRIGRNSALGENAIIQADVGEDCEVGAGCVVSEPLPPGSIASGHPRPNGNEQVRW